MENKDRYYNALIKNNGQLNEIDLGEKFDLHENETREIIVQLLCEHKIEFKEYRACNYRRMNTPKMKNKNR